MMLEDEESLLKDFRRLSLLVDEYLAAPVDQRDPRLRLGLIDELDAMRRRLLAARDRVGKDLQQTVVAYSAASAYGRSHRLRG